MCIRDRVEIGSMIVVQPGEKVPIDGIVIDGTSSLNTVSYTHLDVYKRQVEADGSVYPCDFYVLDEWRLGNICQNTYEELDQKRAELRFIEPSMEHPAQCESCRWHDLCRNGCRRDRLPQGDGGLGINVYCEGFQQFYEHAYARLLQLA